MRICVEHFSLGVVEKVVQGVPFLAVAISDTNGMLLGQLVVHSMTQALEAPREVLLLRSP